MFLKPNAEFKASAVENCHRTDLAQRPGFQFCYDAGNYETFMY